MAVAKLEPDMGLAIEPLISIIVPTFNRRASLGRLLQALAQQDAADHTFEVLVIDDGSTDDTQEFVHALEVPYSLRIFTQAHRGPAEARNLGVTNARGRLILFLDDDVVPMPGLIAAHVEAHAAADGDQVIVGPMSPPNNWPRSAWVRWEEEKLEVQYQAMLAGLYPCTPRQFYTGNSSLPRALFLRAGGFDPTFTRAEDVELGYRLRDLGATFQFRPAAEVWHYAARSFEAWCRTPYQYGRYDVVMSRDKGSEALDCALREFSSRHPLNQLLGRLLTGRGWLLRTFVFALGGTAHTAARVGANHAASRALSAVFNLLYWQGVCDELGDRRALWRAVASTPVL